RSRRHWALIGPRVAGHRTGSRGSRAGVGMARASGEDVGRRDDGDEQGELEPGHARVRRQCQGSYGCWRGPTSCVPAVAAMSFASHPPCFQTLAMLDDFVPATSAPELRMTTKSTARI